MPELSRFEGMIIYMLFRDNKEHNKPHVHVHYIYEIIFFYDYKENYRQEMSYSIQKKILIYNPDCQSLTHTEFQLPNKRLLF